MTIAEKSIIDPDLPQPGVPLRRGTLIGLVLFALVAVLVVVMVTQGGASNEPKPLTAVVNPDQPRAVTSGTTEIIDEEKEKAKPPKTPADNVAEADSPLPPHLRRKDSTAALLDKDKRGDKGPATTGTPLRPTVSPAQSQNDVDVSIEAESRKSKSVTFDESGSAASPDSGTRGMRDIASLINTAGGATLSAPEVKAPSASLQPTIDAAMSAYRANQGGAAAAPVAGDKGWLKEYSGQNASGKNQPIKSYPTTSVYTLHQGKTIPALLGRMINSDLPGTITAFTTTDVYDSLGYGHLLIPKGSSLVGQYSSDVKIGQERVLFAFQRLILPNGQSFDLPGAQGSDLAGASGAEGDVNNHFLKMFASSFFIAYVADKASQPSSVTVVGGGTSTGPAGQVLADTSRTILERNRNIPPTITLPQAFRINVEVVKDMEFDGPYVRRKK